MPEPGAVRWNEEIDNWERFEAVRFGRDAWEPLPPGDPLRAELDALLKSGLFVARKGDPAEDGEVTFQNKRGEWLFWDQALQYAEDIGTYGPPPKDWPAYEDWPPKRIQTAAEAKLAGNVDAEGKPDPQYVPNTQAVTAARQAEKSAAEKAAKEAEKKPSGAFSTAAAARQRAASDPDLAGYQPRYNSSDGQWYLDAPDTADSPIGRETAKLEAEAALVRAQQQQQQAARPKSIDDVILQALLDGNEEKALYFQHFQDRPTRLQALAFAMQYAESPEEFDQLFALAQGPALDYAEQQPVFTQARATLLGGLPPSLGGQATPPTTAALQADAASQSIRFTPEGGTQRWDRENQVWVDVNLPDATSRPTANGGLLPIPTPKQGPFMPEEPTFAQEESTFGDQGVEPFQFKTPTPQEPPINNQEFEPVMAAGPDLGDLPTAEEFREASLRTGGKGVIAPPGVLIPDFVKNNPSVTFYNPDKQNQLFDFINALDEQVGAKGGFVEGEREGYVEAKAGELGIQNPLRKKKTPQTFTPPASVFNRKKKPEPQPTFRTPRYIGAR